MYAIVKSSKSANYLLLQIVGTKIKAKVNMTVSTTYSFSKCVYNSSRIYLLFSSGLIVYETSRMSIVKSIEFVVKDSRTSMSLLLSYVSYSYGSEVFIVDSYNNFSQIYHYTCSWAVM